MVKVVVKPFANFREIIEESELEVEVGSGIISGLLNSLCESYDLRDKIFDGDNIREYVNVLVNGRSINFLEGLKTELSDGDEVAIFPPVAGG
ncbi:MAG: ubiquitin-like small modifier protein 1 [Halobacteriota archaeon]|nr:ubiquitin-like small modifier protein 1 [Halobacteriota archaeon]